jgi:hypothetical protein
LWLKNSSTRIYDLILGPPNNWVWLASRLEEAVKRLWGVQAEHREADAKLGALRSCATGDRNLMLEWSGGTSSLARSLSSATELIEGCIDVVAANVVC